MAEPPPPKKTSVTQFVHSTIGFGLLPAEPTSPSQKLPILTSPEETMASRLQFNAKSGAGITSSDKRAGSTSSDVGYSSLDLGPRSSRGKLPHQPNSQDGSVFGDDIPPLHGACKTKRQESDMELTSLNSVDHTAASRASTSSTASTALLRDRSMSLQPGVAITNVVGQSISWEEETLANHHIFHEVDSREACYFNETSHCQQSKLFHNTKRHKIRCSACKILLHAGCHKLLSEYELHCKVTFREIRQKVRDTVAMHHFLNRRKLMGKSKCSKCEKGFGNWKLNSGREVVSVSCSWCGDSYHPTCFSKLQQSSEPCHMGPLRRLIIPPSWIIRIPVVAERAASQGDDSPKPFSVTRRKTRRSKRKKADKSPCKYFKVKAVSKQQKPLLVFINPKSGGNQGARLLQTFQWLLNPRQVFDLSKGGPMFGLQFFKDLSNVRILACGGDGTVGWVLSIIDELCIEPFPPVAVLPLGTGNDLSRVLGWGGGYSDEPVDKILMHVDEGPVVVLDRWQINVWPNESIPRNPADGKDTVDNVPIQVVNNYFSIGADAQVALDFHLGREANPEKFNKRYKNKWQYFQLGQKDFWQRKFSDLTDYITLHGDGVDLTPRIRSQRLEAICFLNIPSYGAGTNAWGTPSGRDSKIGPQMIDDGHIEIVGFWASTFPKLQMGVSHGERIAQCEHVKMYTTKALPVQIDGEPCKLQPSIIELVQKNTAQMIRKVARKYTETPFRGVPASEQIKLSVSKVTRDQYNRLKSDVQELRRAATPLGLIMSSVQDTLVMVRKQVQSFTEPDEDGGTPLLSKNWRFLDSTSGCERIERMFQVLPDQEHSMTIGHMPSDGLIVVEMDSVVPSETRDRKSFSPSPAENLEHPLDPDADPDPDLEYEGTGRAFGRTHSYRRATSPSCDLCPLPPPNLITVSDSSNLQLQVPARQTSQKRRSISSNASDDGDSESHSGSLRFFDVGSDASTGDNDPTPQPSSLHKALIDAVKRGQVDKVKHYHESGAKLTVTDGNGCTALHHAARLGKEEVVEYLVAHLPKEALDLVEEEKLQTPLHKAAWYGYLNICKLLVENGASLFRQDYQGNTPLSQAKHHGDKELQKYLKSKEREQKSLEQEELAV